MPERVTSTAAPTCMVCRKPVHGGWELIERWEDDVEGRLMIRAQATPDLDHKVCAICYRSLHFACSFYPQYAACNDCYAKAYDHRNEAKKYEVDH